MTTDKPKFKLPEAWAKAFKITAKDPRFGGTIKFVKFLNGVGALSWAIIAEQKSGWIDVMSDAPFAMPKTGLGFGIQEYADYFKRRGFKVETITAKTADNMHTRYNAAVKKMINDADLAAQKAGREKKDRELGRDTPPESPTPAPGDGDGTPIVDDESPIEIVFACTKCSNEWNAVDLGITDPIACPECGKNAGIPKPIDDPGDNE